MSKKKPTVFRQVDRRAEIEDFRIKLVALIKKFPGKRESELPVRWQEEFGVEIDYGALGESSLKGCLMLCEDVIDLYLDDNRERGQHYRVRLKPNAKVIAETLSLPPPAERHLNDEELQKGRNEIEGDYNADHQLSTIIDAACQSCRELPSLPIAFRCGHLICGECLDPGRKAKCQKRTCKEQSGEYRKIPERSELFEKLWELPVTCCNDGCPWRGSRNRSIGHAHTCPFGPEHAKKIFDDGAEGRQYHIQEPMTQAQYDKLISELFGADR